jgi:hypothetical protein
MTLLVCLFFTQTILFCLALVEVWKFGVRMGCKVTLLEVHQHLRQAALADMKPQQKQATKN